MQGDIVSILNEIWKGGATADSLESPTLDFKRQSRSRDAAVRTAAEAAACFANSRGGVLVIGVRDNAPGQQAFEGSTLDPLRVAQQIYDLTEPSLTVSVEQLDFRGVNLLVIRVPRSPDIHQVDHRTTHRVGTSCVAMTAAQIATAVSDRRGEDWSAWDTGRPASDVSQVAMELARGLLRSSPDPARRRYAGETDADLLRVLGIVSGQGTLLRAGELLLCQPEPNGVDVIVYQYRKSAASDPVAVHRLGAPLLRAVLRVLELIEARVDKTALNLPTGQQVQLADLPEAAAREAVVNAVMHRDYLRSGPVQVEHAPTRLRVSSPGPLVLGVTVDNILTTTSRPRNPALARAIRVLGLAEEAGIGVDRMYQEMTRIGHQPPQFADEVDRVAVTLLGGAPNRNVARYVATLPETAADDADALIVLYHLLSHRTITVAQAATLMQKSATEAGAVLLHLAGEQVQMLAAAGSASKPTYRLRPAAVTALGSALSYRPRLTDESTQKVLDLVRAAGQINARVVRVALDLDTTATSRLLGGLVERGLLARTSDSSRGPGVTYGPGPKFPAKPGR